MYRLKLRSSKRKGSVSSEENDYEELYANIRFQVDFPLKSNHHKVSFATFTL